MTTNGPEDQTPRRMPWEPETPAEGTPEPSTPPESGWTPPSPTDPTKAWAPPQAEQPPAGQPPAPPPPWQPPPAGQAGLISSTPVGWSAPPPAAAEVAPGLAFADTTSRVVAYIIDLVILLFSISIVVAVIDPSARSVTETGTVTGIRSPVGSILYAGVGLAYFVVSWTGGRRATIGQRLLNIQVGNAFDGRALTLEQAIRRWLGLGGWIGIFGIVPGLVGVAGLIELVWNIVLLITTATSPTKQGPHDRFANTALVRPSGVGTSGLATACVVIVGLLVLLSVISFIALIFLGGQVSSILSEIGDSI